MIYEAFQQVKLLVERGQADYLQWEEMGKQFDRKRAHVATDRRRLSELQESMSPAQPYLFVGAVLGSVVRHVPDRTTRVAIQADMPRIAGTPDVSESTP